MLDNREMERKLYEMAAIFKNHISAKRYQQAKYCYDKARLLAVEIELEEEKKEELFGIRGKRGEIIKDGLFKEELVQKAYMECCVKAKDSPMNCILCQEQLRGVVKK